MPNIFAYLALISWPFLSIIFYKKMPVVNATYWTIIGGYLVLPVRFYIDFPLIPALGKEQIVAISALIGCKFIKKIRIYFIPKTGMERWLVIIILLTPIFTVLNNGEAYNFKPGLTFHDMFSMIVNTYIKILPLILGMQLVKTAEDQFALFKFLIISALFYSVLVLFEIRISPQLHTWLYGYFPHSFVQQKRFGGFRAVVFLGHGLIVSMYLAIALGAFAILWKQKFKIKNIPPWGIIIYFVLLLFLNKTVSGFILGVLLFVSIAWLSQDNLRRLGLLLIYIVIFYPAISILGYFPHEALISLATDFDPERGGSLAFRFFHENLLLEHAQEKLFFGWGGWSRNLLEGSVKDGFWIGVFGVKGLVGFVALFSLPVLAIKRASKASKILNNNNEVRMVLGHALIVAVIMVDQIPNSSFNVLAVFLIGALLGRCKDVNIKHNHDYKNNHKEIVTGLQ